MVQITLSSTSIAEKAEGAAAIYCQYKSGSTKEMENYRLRKVKQKAMCRPSKLLGNTNTCSHNHCRTASEKHFPQIITFPLVKRYNVIKYRQAFFTLSLYLPSLVIIPWATRNRDIKEWKKITVFIVSVLLTNDHFQWQVTEFFFEILICVQTALI